MTKQYTAMNPFKVIIVEDVKLELKGTEQIFKNEIPEAEIVGTAMNEEQLWPLMNSYTPDLILLDLGLGGSTTAGIDICKQARRRYPAVHILIFTGEIMNERLWVDALDAGADGIVLKTGELLTPDLVYSVMKGNQYVFNQPILQKIVQRFRSSILSENQRSEASLEYDIDEYDERFLRHLALGYTKEMIANLRTMPFGVKSLEKRQADLVRRLFSEDATGVNATRLVTKALQLNIINLDNLTPDA